MPTRNPRTDEIPEFLFINNSRDEELILESEINFAENYYGRRWGYVHFSRDSSFVMEHDTNDSDETGSDDTEYTDANDNEITYEDIQNTRSFAQKLKVEVLDRYSNIIFKNYRDYEEWSSIAYGIFYRHRITNKLIINPFLIFNLIKTNEIQAFEEEYNLSLANDTYKELIIKICNDITRQAPAITFDASRITHYFAITEIETVDIESPIEENPETSDIVIHQKHPRFQDITIPANIKECQRCKHQFYSEENICPNCKKKIKA